jgi:hypothetical protein
VKVKTVSITYERKINLGDYNSATIGLTLWADVDEDEAHDQVVTELQRQARELARDEYRRLIKPGQTPANGTVK